MPMGGALQKCLGQSEPSAPATTSRELPPTVTPAEVPAEPVPAYPAAKPGIAPAEAIAQTFVAETEKATSSPAKDSPSSSAPSTGTATGMEQPVATNTSIVQKPLSSNEAGPWENVGWLNAFMSQAWPGLNEAASKTAKDSLDAMLKQYQPDAIETLKVNKIHLGEEPPVFREVRVRTERAPDEIVLDIKLDWTKGKPQLFLGIKPRYSFALEIKLKDLDLVAWTRVAFKPLTGAMLPSFGAITIALQEEPHIDFTIEALGGVTNLIPGLDALIDSTVKGAIIDALLWPNRIVVPIIPREDNYKDLLFWPSGELLVSSICGSDLPTQRSLQDLSGTPDPIVWFYVRKKADRIIKTTPKANDKNPKWDEELKVAVEDPALQNLTVVVMDEESLGQGNFIGMAVIPLAGIVDGEERDIAVDLRPEAFFMAAEQRAKAGNADQTRGKLSFKMRWHKYLPEEVPPIPAPAPPKEAVVQPAPESVSDVTAPETHAAADK